MQGRTLPYKDFFVQKHSPNYYILDFFLIKKININYIEYIIGEQSTLVNFYNTEFLSNLINKSKVNICSVILNFALDKNILNLDYEKLIYDIYLNAKKFKIENIVIPLLEKSSLKKIKNFKLNLSKLKNINLIIESDLSLSDTLDVVNNDKIKLCLDLGNYSHFGHGLNDIKKYHKKIGEIHVKDRDNKGNNVCLGKGNVKFNETIRLMKDFKNIPIVFEIMQQKNNSNINLSFNYLKKNISFFKNFVNEKK